MRRAVLFDLDGTLIDSAPDMHHHLAAVLKKMGRIPISLDEVIDNIGGGARKMVTQALEQTGGTGSPDILTSTVAEFLALYQQEPARLTKVYPDGRDILQELQSEGIVLGLCTNKPRVTADPVLKSLKLEPYFDFICCGDDVAFQKPDGRHILHILDRLNVPTSDAAMVGDSFNDLEAAVDAGVASIMVTYGYDRHILNHPYLEYTVSGLGEIPGLLKRMSLR